jgi:cell division protein FtsI (penicillin-binding protein 3)
MRTLLGGAIDEGTGLPAQFPGYTAGGKTGTAQIPENGHYSKRFVASFVGVAPLKDPQFVILTLVRDPKGGDHYGGSVAGPVFKQIAERALLLRRTPHDREKTLTGVKKKAVTVEA